MQELLEILGLPYTGSGVLACMRSMDKVLTKHLLDRGGRCPTPEFFSFNETAFKTLGAAETLPAIEERLDFPIVVKPASGGSALGIKFASDASHVPARAGEPASPTTRGFCSSATSAGRDLAVSVVEGADGPEALPIVEAVPRDEDFYDFEARYEIGRTDFVCPAVRARRGRRPRAASWRSTSTGCSACYGFARIDLMLDSESENLYVLEANAIPGLTETSLLPQAAEAAGIGFDELVERILELAWARGAGAAAL